MCAGDAAGLIVGGEGAANGAGATAGAGFVAAEPAPFEAVAGSVAGRELQRRDFAAGRSRGARACIIPMIQTLFQTRDPKNFCR
jgi:hypothetical protein